MKLSVVVFCLGIAALECLMPCAGLAMPPLPCSAGGHNYDGSAVPGATATNLPLQRCGLMLQGRGERCTLARIHVSLYLSLVNVSSCDSLLNVYLF